MKENPVDCNRACICPHVVIGLGGWQSRYRDLNCPVHGEEMAADYGLKGIGVSHNFIPVHDVLNRYDQQLASLTHKWILQDKPISWWRRLMRWLSR